MPLTKLTSKKKGRPIVSIICVTYNHVNYIEQAIKGFLVQKTNFPVEILIHDDCSFDGTQQLINKYKRKYPWLISVVIQNKNQWSQGKRKMFYDLYRSAKGKYIALCEGDDCWTDSLKLFKQVTFLKNNPSFSITYARAIPYYEKYAQKYIQYNPEYRDLSQDELRLAPSLATLTTCFKKINYFPPEIMNTSMGDLFLWSLCGEKGSGKYLDNIKPSLYRVHNNSVHSLKTKISQHADYICTCILVAKYFKRKGDDITFKKMHRKVLFSCIDFFIKDNPILLFLSKARYFFLKKKHHRVVL